MSRYTSRYESDRRSRSPRDRSPDRYNDRTSQYSDGDRRRLSGESRSNQQNFQSNRDGFRDSLTGREPPRGPKALLDPPSGPRGGYSSDFRGGRGGRGRGRGWRDDSRDRGRDRDDFRDRRDFRDDRSRERDNRDWRDRERDNFRGRRPSPQGRTRSPPGRDFRDRDIPLGVDADRARRGSRDGPLSAGSSSSDPPFGNHPYRDDMGRGGRGKRPMRGQGWGSAGRGRQMYMDDRDHRYPPSPLQENRWGRDEDRDTHRRDPMLRDLRDDRDPRDRESVRPKPNQPFSPHGTTNPPPTAKDASPPPTAPAAPPFGSVTNRNPSVPDVQGPTGKAPPTGPRALTEDRPVSSGQSAAPSDRFPPSGPAKAAIPENNPIIPVGPRAQQKQQPRPSSKQWINPNLAGRKVPDSPKINRSQSFVSQQGRPFGTRPASSHSDHQTDYARRPRSSDANAESQLDSADSHLHSNRISEPGEIRDERGTQSARASMDRESRGSFSSHGLRPPNLDFERPQSGKPVSPASYKGASPTFSRATITQTTDIQASDSAKISSGVQDIQHRAKFSLASNHISLPSRQPAQTLPPSAEDSDDEDDNFDWIQSFTEEIAKLEAEERAEEQKKEAEAEARSITNESVAHAGWIIAQFTSKLADESSSLENVLDPIPEGLEWPRPPVQTEPGAMTGIERQTPAATGEDAAKPASAEAAPVDHNQEPEPKVEEVDSNNPQVPIPTVEKDDVRDVDEDVVMDDAPDAMPTLNGPFNQKGLMSPPGFGQSVSRQSTASQMDEDDDATEIEDADYLTLETVRHPMATPPLDDIPVFNCVAWHKDKRFLKTLSPKDGVDQFIMARMAEVHEVKLEQEEDMRRGYANRYETYLGFTMSDDPAAVKSREKFAGGPVTTDAPPSIAGPEPKPEGRGANRRWASERDVQRILEESMREENERKEREARNKKEKFRSEKEAEIPEMCWTPGGPERELFADRCGYLPPEKLIAGLQVLPPHINFTTTEVEQFEQAYLEFPKQWGRIADRIPERDFHASIQYYYASKRDLNLKEKLRKQPRKRKKNPRGKQRSSALVSELGNGENEGEENAETGENGERRRPRRAAAPTFGEQTPAADSDGNTPVGTPGRRTAAALASKNNDSGAEKVEGKKKGRRAAKDKEPKQPKLAQAIAPTPAPGTKAAAAARSRSNSRAQMPAEWPPGSMQQDNGFRISGREPLPAGMQPPMMPSQQGLLGLERTPVPAAAPMSDVMAPPALRPEPPLPQAGIPTFDAGQLSGQDRVRAGMPTSYWSVSEMHDFPALLKAFGTDWTQMANHMQSKTATMVKNYFQRGKEGKIERACKEEWETLAREADLKRQRGEKCPNPPVPSSGPRKRYDAPGMRPLAVADAVDGMGTAKTESQPLQQAAPFTSTFKVPVAIAQAPPAQPPLAPTIQQQQPLQLQQQASPQGISQAMSPPSRNIKPPANPFGYPEREADLLSQKQPLRMPPKQPTSPVAATPISEPLTQHRAAAWPNPKAGDAVDDALQALSQKRRHQASEPQQRDEVRQPERGPAVRLKQDPDAGRPFEPFGHPQLQARAAPTARGDPLTMARQPEQPPPRTLVPAQAPSAYPPAAPQQQQSMRALLAEPPHHQARELERPMSGGQRPSGSLAEPYPAPAPPALNTTLAPSPAPTPGPSPIAAAPRPPTERKVSSLMGLLNDEPAPPKRIPEVASAMKPSSTPPPQAMARPPPVTSGPPPLRREPERESYSPFGRSQSAMPPLNPYAQPHTQSPQPQHMPAPRPVGDMGSSAERDYYARHPYHQQHQPPATNSPQSHTYPASGQPSQLGYQSQPQGYAPYGAPSSQSHSASPTPQYATHAPRGREPLRPSKEAGWPSQEPRGMSSAQQQQQAAPHQQHQQHQQQAPQHRQQPGGWPPSASHQPPPKVQPPAQSAWGAQHGGTPKPPTASSSNQPPSSWSSGPQQQAHHMPMRDERGYPVHDSRAQHQHSHSLSGGYPAPLSRGEAPPPSQQPYPRYSSTPGPGQSRDPRDPGPPRSFTPAPLGYDNRGPPQHGAPDPRHGYGAEHRDMQLREPMRDPRDARGDPRDAGQQPPQQQPPPGNYGRALRPHDDFNRPPDRYR